MRIRFLEMLEHHPEHYIKLKIFGETFKPCARCLGQYTIGLPFFLLFMLLYYIGYTFDFTTIFTISWILSTLTILDWSSVEILHIRKGNNTTRLLTGGTLGIGVSMYLWLLPTNWAFKLSTLTIYFLIITAITFAVKCKKQGINPIEEINKNIDQAYYYLTHPKYFFVACTCCPCCSTGCCCGGTTACCPLVMCLCSCIPCLCCPLASKSSGCGSCNSCPSCSTCGSCGSGGNAKK